MKKIGTILLSTCMAAMVAINASASYSVGYSSTKKWFINMKNYIGSASIYAYSDNVRGDSDIRAESGSFEAFEVGAKSKVYKSNGTLVASNSYTYCKSNTTKYSSGAIYYTKSGTYYSIGYAHIKVEQTNKYTERVTDKTSNVVPS